MLACYPGRRHCKLKAGASLRNNGGGGFGGKLEIRRSRISREREKGGEGSMVNLREGLLLPRCDLGFRSRWNCII